MFFAPRLRRRCHCRFSGVVLRPRELSRYSPRWMRRSATCRSTSDFKNLASRYSSLSCASPTHVAISIPLASCREKLSGMLSTMMVLSSGRPSLDRSLMKTPVSNWQLLRYSRCEMTFSFVGLSESSPPF